MKMVKRKRNTGQKQTSSLQRYQSCESIISAADHIILEETAEDIQEKNVELSSVSIGFLFKRNCLPLRMHHPSFLMNDSPIYKL